MPPHAHAHIHAAHADRSVCVHVITVSTSRNTTTDLSGPLLRNMLEKNGHRIAGSSLVSDNPQTIGELLDTLLKDPAVEAIVLTGGTGISARDCTPEVVRSRLDRVIPGFGELFRQLSYEHIGPAAMLSNAVAGIAKGRPIFAIPGSTSACALAMDKLILPEIGHICYEVAKETPLPPRQAPPKPDPAPASAPVSAPAPRAPVSRAAPVIPPPPGISAAQIQAADTRRQEPDLATGWRAAVRELKAELKINQDVVPPDSVSRLASVRDVLWAAGERGTLTLPGGRQYLAFGYPDLSRNTSKVILVSGESGGLPEIVALHRWPRRVGICPEGEGLLPSVTSDPVAVSVERCGRAAPAEGRLFAVEGSAVYLIREIDGRDRVAQWDGRRLGGWEPPGSLLGTLSLFWSQR